MTGLEASAPCDAERGIAGDLWDETARSVLSEGTQRLLAAGFAGAPVDGDAVMDGTVAPPRVGGPLVVYASFINMSRGDRVRLTLNGPGGFAVEHMSEPLDDPKATWTVYAGKRGAPPGAYRATLMWLRGTTILVQKDDLSLTLR